MAERFFRKYAREGYEPISAGTKPASQVNPMVVQAMKEAEVNIKHQKPKDIAEGMIRNSTKIVNMGCIDLPLSIYLIFILYLYCTISGKK